MEKLWSGGADDSDGVAPTLPHLEPQYVCCVRHIWRTHMVPGGGLCTEHSQAKNNQEEENAFASLGTQWSIVSKYS